MAEICKDSSTLNAANKATGGAHDVQVVVHSKTGGLTTSTISDELLAEIKEAGRWQRSGVDPNGPAGSLPKNKCAPVRIRGGGDSKGGGNGGGGNGGGGQG